VKRISQLVLACLVASGCSIKHPVVNSSSQEQGKSTQAKVLSAQSNEIKGYFYIAFHDDAQIRPETKGGKKLKANKGDVRTVNEILQKYKVESLIQVAADKSDDEVESGNRRTEMVLSHKETGRDGHAKIRNPHSTYYVTFPTNVDGVALVEELNATGLVDVIRPVQKLQNNGTNMLGVHQFAAPPSDAKFSAALGSYTTYPDNDLNYYHFNRHAVFSSWTYYNSLSGTVLPKVAVINVGAWVSPRLDSPSMDTTLARQYFSPTSYTSTYQTSTVNADTQHGAYVASILASPKNTVGWCGVNPSVQIVPLVVVDDATLDAAIRYAADSNVKVINISIGTTNNTVEALPNVASALLYAVGKGCTPVLSAGNDGALINYNSSSYTGSIVVGGLDKTTGFELYDTVNGKITNHGTRVDVSAAAKGIVGSADVYGDGSASGTSFAAPIVSGLVAYLYAIEPNLTTTDVRNILHASSDVSRTDDTRQWRLGFNMDITSDNSVGYGARAVDFDSSMRMLKAAKGGWAVRAFNSNDQVKAKLPSGSWTSPLVTAPIYDDRKFASTAAKPTTINFESYNASGNRTYAGAVLSKDVSGRYVGGARNFGINRRYNPDESRIFTDVTVTPASGTYNYFDLYL
jgi:hypothetical protein